MNIVRTLCAGVAAVAITVGGAIPAVAADSAPGTSARPILSEAEAVPFVEANYFGWSGPYAAPVADAWQPAAIVTRRPDFVVGRTVGALGVTHTSVQAAVNAAFRAGGTARRYVGVLPGTYTGTVFVPAGGPPLTIFGVGRPEDVRLEFRVDATVSPAAWAALVNPSGQYVDGDPAWRMFQSCANRTSATVGLCATVVWAQADDFQLRGLTVTNTLLDSVDAGTHQGLAVRTDGDRTQLELVRLVGRQDTFYANAGTSGRISRVLVRASYIEGDTDFVFGNAVTVFEASRFQLVSSRKPTNGVIFAPSTNPLYPYGFLVLASTVTADEGYQAQAAPSGHFGRAWDQGAGAGYVPGVSPNGQLVIRDSTLGAGFNTTAPWSPAATTSRPFAASVDPSRDLNDAAHNRLWEFDNAGPSATG